MKTKFKSLVEDYKLLLRNVPSLIIAMMVLSTVLMNIMANKVIFQWGDMLTADGGFLFSWIPFLCMDIVTKRFGPKAAIQLNIFSAFINLCCVGLFDLVVLMPGNGEDFSAFDSIFGSTWFILLGSMVAFIVSGIANSLINAFIGVLLRSSNDKVEYVCRTYISTFIGQFLDNFIFSFIVFYVFAPIFWGWGFTILLCIGSSILGAMMELVMEMIFSPIGYKVCKHMKQQGIGNEYLEREGIVK